LKTVFRAERDNDEKFTRKCLELQALGAAVDGRAVGAKNDWL